MFAVSVGVVGLLAGPWVSALVDSVPDYSGGGRTFNTCASCEATHGWPRFVPILGALRCSNCGESIRRTALVLHLLTPLVFALAAWWIGTEIELVPVLGFAAVLLALSATDIERYRLPDRLLLPAFVALVVAVVVVSLASGSGDHVVPALVGAFAYFVALLVPNLISPGGLAFGDVKLALLLGLFLGWLRTSVTESLVLVIYALLLGMCLGGVTGFFVGVARRVWGPGVLPDPDVPESERDQEVPILKTQFPFGPALAAAAVAVMILSDEIIGSPGLL